MVAVYLGVVISFERDEYSVLGAISHKLQMFFGCTPIEYMLR